MRYARVFTRFFRGLKCHVGAGRKLPAQSPLFTCPVPPLHLPSPPSSPAQSPLFTCPILPLHQSNSTAVPGSYAKNFFLPL